MRFNRVLPIGVFSMLISNINNCSSFKANMPVYKAYVVLKNGSIKQLSDYEIKGPVQALVSRLNKDTPIADFFKQFIPDFNSTQRAESTIVGKNSFICKHILFGEDAIIKKNLGINCYKHQNMSKEEINDYIKNTLLAPLYKKVKLPRYEGDNTGEQVGLVLYTKEVSKDCNKLTKVQVTNLNGTIFKEIEVK